MIDKVWPIESDGFVILKKVMGDDPWIDQCARHSADMKGRTRDQTRRLIRYMIKNAHTSPFEFSEMVFHVRVPMDTWRQWIRHRTASVNEYSTRYSEAINSQATILPHMWRKQSTSNRQGSSCNCVEDHIGAYLSRRQLELQEFSRQVYQERLDAGVAREQARMDLPLSTYTEAFWKSDLHNLLHFLKLRCAPEAQQEIREYANVIRKIVEHYFPITFEAWTEFVESK